MKKKKDALSNIFLIFAFVAGLSLLLYPSISDYWNSVHQSRAIAVYTQQMEHTDDDETKAMMEAAKAYNKRLASRRQTWFLNVEQKAEYERLLDVTGTGIMAYVEIPKIKVSLPIYHGVEESVLQIAIGHIEGTSLPVGGTGTHCAISGHRGLPSARLFSELDKMGEGDVFMIRVLDETLTYEVDQIRIVDPDEMDDLRIEKGRDYCTLVTCTPYGLNTHRMLVRGHRIENLAGDIAVSADAVELEPLLVAPVLAVPILLGLFIMVVTKTGKRKKV